MDMLSNLFSPSNAREIKNSLYDPAFEAIGLPIDPHLRISSSHVTLKSIYNNHDLRILWRSMATME
ncbi:hypothetical protein Prudu_004345 [Prunus dulcis]|uniref:Uncharacterized protein n=1 Tax=Prunus dulcis TaxID=3755 RepID=A0A4Y1QV22_PRUDU|nr:hypothetical protein Prudu_004345 [Prunus dulcis]